MRTPNLRCLIVPLGAVCTLATLASQDPQLRAQQDNGTTTVRERVTDCSPKSRSDICMIAPGNGIH